MTWLFDVFGVWLKNSADKFIGGLFSGMIGFFLSLSGGIFDSPEVEVFFEFSLWLNMSILVISLILVCFDIAEEAGRVDFSRVFVNLLKGLCFVLFNRYGALMVFEVADSFVRGFGFNYSGRDISQMLPAIVSGDILWDAVIIGVLLMVSTIVFCISSLLRSGTMFVIIMSSSFYVSDVVRGDTSKLSDWTHQVIATSMTYVFQYVLFFLGADAIMSGSLSLAFIWLGTMFSVPKILMRFGSSSGTKGVIGAVGSVMGTGIRMVV